MDVFGHKLQTNTYVQISFWILWSASVSNSFADHDHVHSTYFILPLNILCLPLILWIRSMESICFIIIIKRQIIIQNFVCVNWKRVDWIFSQFWHTHENGIWRNLLSIQNEANSLVCNAFWLVQRDQAAVKLEWSAVVIYASFLYWCITAENQSKHMQN